MFFNIVLLKRSRAFNKAFIALPLAQAILGQGYIIKTLL